MSESLRKDIDVKRLRALFAPKTKVKGGPGAEQPGGRKADIGTKTTVSASSGRHASSSSKPGDAILDLKRSRNIEIALRGLRASVRN